MEQQNETCELANVHKEFAVDKIIGEGGVQYITFIEKTYSKGLLFEVKSQQLTTEELDNLRLAVMG